MMALRQALPLLLLLVARPGLAQVTKVDIFPSFETAGIQITCQGDPSSTSITVQYREKGVGTYVQAHPPVRYDARHAATSLFDLTSGKSYEVQVNGQTYSFTARPPFSLPAPKRVVNIQAGDSAGLRAALTAALPGDEIRIPKGSYTGGFKLTKSGTEASPIVVSGALSAADTNRTIEQRTDLPVLTNSGGVGVTLSAAHVVLQHVRVANASGNGVLLDSCRHCVVQHCQVYDNDDYSDTSWRFNIHIRGGGLNDETKTAGYNLIQFNHVADTDSLGFDTGSPPDGASGVTYYGINATDTPGPGLVIRGNRVERHFDGIVPCPDEGDDPGESSTDALAARKQSSHDVEVYDNYIYFSRDDGIESDGFCVNARIFRNTIVTANNGVSVAPALPGPFFWVRNRVRDIREGAIKINTSFSNDPVIRNHYFYHNTFSKESTDGYLMNLGGGTTTSKNLYYKNNIFYAGTELVDNWGSHVPNPTVDGNLWYSTASTQISWTDGTYSDFSDFQSSTGQETHGIWADPLLDGSTLDIKSGSPAIDKAVAIPGINHLVAGSGPDIGAHELGQPKPVQPDAGPPADSGTAPSPDAGVPGPPPTGDGGAVISATPVLEGGCSVAETTGGPGWLALALLALLLVRRS